MRISHARVEFRRRRALQIPVVSAVARYCSNASGRRSGILTADQYSAETAEKKPVSDEKPELSHTRPHLMPPPTAAREQRAAPYLR